LYVIIRDMEKRSTKNLIPQERDERKILLVRGQNMMLDHYLTAVCGAEQRALVEAVKRDRNRFSDAFVLQPASQESDNLRSQSVTSRLRRGGRRHSPYALT